MSLIQIGPSEIIHSDQIESATTNGRWITLILHSGVRQDFGEEWSKRIWERLVYLSGSQPKEWLIPEGDEKPNLYTEELERRAKERGLVTLRIYAALSETNKLLKELECEFPRDTRISERYEMNERAMKPKEHHAPIDTARKTS